MNTKNIFRMLLVAAALLLGANNLKATEETIWSNNAKTTVELDKSVFTSLTFTPNLIKVYADHVNSRFWAKDANEILWRASQYNEYVYADGSDYDKAHYKTDHYEFEITSDILSKLKENGLKIVQDYGNGITSIVVSNEGSSTSSKSSSTLSFSPSQVELTFGSTFTAPTVTKTPSDAAVTYSSSDSKIALIDGSGNVVPVGAGTATITGTFAGNDTYNGTSASYTLKVNAPTISGANWQGAVWLDWNNQINTNIPTNDTFKNIKVGDQILIYGKRGPLHETNFNLELFQLNSNWSWGTKFVELSQSDFSSENGCFTITVNNDNVEDIQNGLKDNVQGYCAAANGYNFTITAIKVISASSDTEHGTYASNTWTFNFATMAGTVQSNTNLTLTEVKTINEVKMHKASWTGNYINTKLLLGEGSNETWQLRPSSYDGTLYLNNSNKKIGFQSLKKGQAIKLNIVVEESGSDGAKSKKYPTSDNNYNVTLTTNPNGDGVYIFTVSADGDAYINLGNKTYIKSIIIDPAPAPVTTYNVEKSVSGSGDIEFLTDYYQIGAGATVQFRLNPSAGYQLSNLWVRDANYSSVSYTYSNGVYSFTMPASNVTVEATFATIPTFSVSTITGENGNIAFSTSYENIYEGASVSFTVSAYEGYELSSVTVVDANSYNVSYTYSNGVYSFTMPASNVTVTAVFTEIPPQTREVTVGGNGYKYSTWTPDIAIDYSLTPTGVKAFRARGTTTEDNQLYVELEQITGKVYANTPVILAADTEGSQTFTFTQAVKGASDAGTNLLRQGTGSSIGPNDNYYVLTLKDGVVVFAQTKSNSAVVPTDKAYLDLSSVSGARSYTIRLSFGGSNDGTTAISGIESDNDFANGEIYNLNGQRVDKPAKGLYIINGKKVLIK